MLGFVLFLICLIILGIFVPIATESKYGAPNWMVGLIFGVTVFMAILIPLVGLGVIK